MKQAASNSNTPVTAVRPRRSFRWIDSLVWLAIAGALTAMLVPAKSEQTASKHSAGGNESLAATPGEQTLPSPIHGPGDAGWRDEEYSPSGHEFILQNEADFLNSQNAPPAPPDAEVGRRPGENTPDDSPRVTSGPTLNGPQLENPVPR